MAKPIEGLPKWFPAWLWRAICTPWFCSAALGFAGYEFASLINDVTGALPFWVRLLTGVLSGLMVRLGIHLEWRAFEANNAMAEFRRDSHID